MTAEHAGRGARAGTVDVFGGTTAELTWYEVERAARRGAVLLWAFGVLEQHGPHLPTGTDVYLPSAHLQEVRAALAGRGVEALVVPPFYWGVNVVSAGFPASYSVRPEIIREVMADLVAGMARDGFGSVFCFSGHGDALHNETVHAGARLAAERTGVDVSFVADPALVARLGLSPDDPHLTVTDPAGERPARAGAGIDVHAGRWESAMMMVSCPDLVREETRRTLRPTGLGAADLAVWRRGAGHARRTTPQGYLGDPAAASAAEGDHLFAEAARLAAEAVVRRLAAVR
ncbi:creatininase family protein [Geodermatophilus marinus]|uniref:creatininase family protein n=1 Tax=Geodermatophilus sp. LHW52908 TaxID=2303986 RepID=UPI000E3C7E66|nr:creatininase family protein [Geodermatophilus sp. LHW52908]RFU22366.1 creatininase family protein [Geodermatophilus sp. LHW52908]